MHDLDDRFWPEATAVPGPLADQLTYSAELQFRFGFYRIPTDEMRAAGLPT